eukprot:gene38241-47216_t
MTPLELRHKVRSGEFRLPTAGYCGEYAQANLVILPGQAPGRGQRCRGAQTRPGPG